MKKYIFLGIVVALGLWAPASYNSLVGKREVVLAQIGQVQNVMQRQADLIPNMVETVKGYANFEGKTLTAVTEARAKLTAAQKMDPAKLAADPEMQKQLIAAQAATGSFINLVKEAYPDLKAHSQFDRLMAGLEGSQNRITEERRRWQFATGRYNVARQTFPNSLWGFERMEYFAADEGARTVPTVKFP